MNFSNLCSSILYEALTPNKTTCIDLIEISRKKKKKLIILADFTSFVTYILTRFSIVSLNPNLLLDSSPLIRYEYAEYFKFKNIVLLFIQVLRQQNIEFEFVCGDSGSIVQENNEKIFLTHCENSYCRLWRIEEVLTSTDISNVCRVFSVCSEYVPTLPLMEREIITALRHVGCKVWESDDNLPLTICGIVAQRQQGNLEGFTKQCLLKSLPPIFAVFSDNVEFGLMENCFQWMPPKLFDVSNRLLWLFQRIIMDVPDFFTNQLLPFPLETIQYLISLEAHIVTSKNLETLCHLNRNQLTALFVTFKNQLTCPSNDVLLTKLYKNSQLLCITDFEKISKFLPSFVQTNDSAIQTQTNDNPLLLPVCHESYWINPKFYNMKMVSESMNPFLDKYLSSIYIQWRLGGNIFHLINRPFDAKKLLQKKTATLFLNKEITFQITSALMHCFCIPLWLYRASQSHIFYRLPYLEYTSLQGYVIQDILLDLRRCCYGILSPSTTCIKEIGRSSNNFNSIIYCYPIALPHCLKLENVFKLNHTVNDNEAWLNYTREFVITFLSHAGRKSFQLRHMKISLLKLYFYVLCALQWCYEKDKKKHDCFLKHELHSLIASIIVTAGQTYECNNEFIVELPEARECLKKVNHKLSKKKLVCPVKDPLQQCFTALTQENPNVHRVVLYGLIPGFRSTFLFGFFQIVWDYLLDISNVYQCVTRKNSEKLTPAPSLLFNGTIFRWMYAAGALQWKDRKTFSQVQMCLMLKSGPTHIHSTCQTQIKWIQLFRLQLLKTSLAKSLMPSDWFFE